MYRIMDLAWQVQGRIYDFAILLGTLLMPHYADPRVRDALWRLQRHLNLLHVLAYEEVSEGVKNVSRDHDRLKHSGLLEHNEIDDLDEAESRVTIVFVWLSDLTNRLIDSRIVPQAFASAILEALTELLDIVSMFHHEILRTPPVQVSRMMQLLADVMCLLTPPMLAYVFHADDPSSPTYFWPWSGSMAVALFYQGMISLSQALEANPFDDHMDGLNPDWALQTTERQVFGCLAGGQAGGPALPVEPLKLTQKSVPKEVPAPSGAPGFTAAPVANSAVGSALAAFAPEGRLEAEGRMGEPIRTGYAMAIPSANNGAASSTDAVAVARVGARPVTEISIDSPREVVAPVATNGVPQMKKSQVPGETVPLEGQWVPREVGDRGGNAMEAEAKAGVPPSEQSPVGSRWGTLDQELLQATRAALLVPREITLDDVSLERLETVTARPLSELAAALLRAEPAPAPADATEQLQLALTEAAHVHSPNDRAESGSHQAEAAEITDLIGKYHHELRQNSDMRAQLAAVQSGLAQPEQRTDSRQHKPHRAVNRPIGAGARQGPGGDSTLASC